jgi:hypothetical protein
MVHPGLVSCHNSMEKSISFTSMTVQLLLTNRLPCTLVIIGKLLWDPSATHFPIPEVIMDNTVRRAVTHVEFYGIFINCDSPVVTDPLLDLLFHCLSCHTNWSPTLVFITDVLSSVLKSFHPFIHTPLTQTTVSIPNLHSSVDFRRFHTHWPRKTNNALLLFHSTSWQWSGHVVQAIAQAHTARSSWLLYGILLRSHFVSWNKIFLCTYFSMHFRIKFLLFNDFTSYTDLVYPNIHHLYSLWIYEIYIVVGACWIIQEHVIDKYTMGRWHLRLWFL